MISSQGIVIQTGMDRCKAGFSGDDFYTDGYLKADFSTVVGIDEDIEKDSFVGDQVYERNNLDLKFPIDYHGVIQDFESMITILSHCYNELNIDPSDHPCLMTEAYFNPKLNKEKTAKMMFETFNVPAFYLENSGALSLFSSSRTTGVVVDCGEGVSHIVPIYEGYTHYPFILNTHLTGRDITNYCMDKMHEAGYRYSYQRKIFRDIKERCCYVALDYDSEVRSSKNRLYELPDGTNVKLKDQRFGIPEILFQPQLTGRNNLGLGLSNLTFKCIMECDIDERKDLLNNIVLSGGTTMFSGFPERLSKDITSLAFAQGNRAKVIAQPERLNSAFVGGSILSSLSTFEQVSISKAEYDEEGTRVIHRKQNKQRS